ncbi:hypothetical protein [Methylocystis bryophila]|uniref:ATP-grasp domain-containing protein n=2 Tax=Methylocystis bryophila TaxID=655015 RepID=A0A1W6MT80_9HYPH|nr:hypothetical protein [Methylocystis bryophila]ARN80810.1 hypothetical protein B1812_06670 [Methylocystis bryophila]
MNILIVSFEDERWGVIRLVKPLTEAGFAVAALCPAGDALTQTRYLCRRYALDSVKNSRRIELALAEALRDWKPAFVIPGDERAVVFLHVLVRRAKTGERLALDAHSLATLMNSLGDFDHYDTLLMKSETVALARQCGMRTPEGGSAVSAEDAVRLAERIGCPVYLKQSFSWAGRGVIRCHTPAEVASAFASLQPRHQNPLYTAARRLLRRDWYPVSTRVDVQQSVDGFPAFYAALAWKGKMLAGFAGFVERASSANGPSCVVRLGAHEEMASASCALIAAAGATGFIGFDFMIEHATGKAFLLECNLRPVQATHLGSRIGVNLCEALADAIRGVPTPHPPPKREETVALFPQEWRRDPVGLADFRGFVDAPLDDPALLARMTGGKPLSATFGAEGADQFNARD